MDYDEPDIEQHIEHILELLRAEDISVCELHDINALMHEHCISYDDISDYCLRH